jgi:hydroxymethylpyrimidine kinase / phosphomethylpyrimidine kinase / thiamine-phosphate diphosphorylase
MRLLTIAGHDPVHGAGITADLAAWAAMGLEGASVLTTLTAQNSRGLQQVQAVDAMLVRAALQAVLDDGEPAAIKVGMLGSMAVAREIAAFLAARRCPVVLDPVMAGSNGRAAFDANIATWLAALWEVAPHADVVTPNLPEAAVMLGVSEDEAVERLAELRAGTGAAVVLKGGHGQGAWCVDHVDDGTRRARVAGPRHAGSVHGTGCMYASVLAGMLACGWDVFDAACEARLRVGAGLVQARQAGPGRPNVQPAPRTDSRHLPSFHWDTDRQPEDDIPEPFAPLRHPLGFYAVLPSADWIERALASGVRTLQLRIKHDTMPAAERRAQLRAAIRAAAEVPGAQLFVNDHWQDAIALGAYGVHLGQEDVASADLHALRAAGLRLGLSTHTPLEISRAHGLRPSYLAIGPVYPTTLKAMRYPPVGLKRLRDWARRCRPAHPVVAIGGIDLARAPDVLVCGVDAVAVVSALTQAADPHAAAQAFLRLMGAPSRCALP